MKATRETRARPAIEPIQTDHARLKVPGPVPRSLASFSNYAPSVSPVSPGGRPPPLYPHTNDNDMMLHDKATVDKLDSRYRSPARGGWPVSSRAPLSLGEISLPAPRGDVSPRCPLSAPPVMPADESKRRFAPDPNPLARPGPENAEFSPGVLPPLRRLSAPSGAAAFRLLRFQQFQGILRRQGTRSFGDASRADAFVVPVGLRRPFLTPDSPSGAAILPHSNRHTVRAVIHPRNGPPVALTRDFDLDALRATVPEPVPTPTTPHFDRGLSPVVLAARSGMLSPASPATLDSRRASNAAGRSWDGIRSPASAGPHRAGFPPMPIHLAYARAQLPVLAAIMMSDRVRRGDIIDMPMPYPAAWRETVAFVYTGEEELATGQVRQNILYLGGKV